MDRIDLESASGLRTRTPERLLGVSPESLYLTLYAVANDTEQVAELRPVFRADTLESNLAFDYQTAAEFNRALCDDLGFLDGSRVSDLARVLLASRDPVSNLRACVALRSRRIRTYLLEFLELDSDVIERSDLESLSKDAFDEQITIPLLQSLGFAEVFPQGAIPDLQRIRKTVAGSAGRANDPQRTVHLLRAVTGVSEEGATEVAARFHDTSPENIDEIDERTVVRHMARSSPTYTNLGELKEVTGETIEALQTDVSKVERALTNAVEGTVSVGGDPITYGGLVDRIGGETAEESVDADSIADLIYTVSRTQAFGYLPPPVLEEVLGMEIYEIYRVLSALDGVACSIEADTLQIESVPSIASKEEETLSADLIKELTKHKMNLQWLLDALDAISMTQTSPEYEQLVSGVFRGIDEDAVAPTYLAYTLPDPDELGEEVMDRYVGGSENLMKERAKLRRWQRHHRPDDAKRYTELTDRVISRGLSHDLEEKVLRIMTPYDDDTFSEFTSQFRSLLREGYEIRLLTRHTRKRWQWERLRDNLLGELTTNRDNVSIRTYSRYKTFQRITDMTDETDLDEFGIHAKLQTIGNPEEGAALVGSANLMENSYYWNPECGAYSEKRNFVAAALSFFDHVWDIAAADTVDLQNLQQIPERSYYPSYYT